MKKRMKKLTALFCVSAVTLSLAACGGNSSESSAGSSTGSDSSASSASSAADSSAESAASLEELKANVMSNEEILQQASEDGTIGNWGLGNEYEVLALESKYGLPNEFLSQSYDMDGFDTDTVTLASAMTYNELGLVVNDYDGGYGYGDTVGTIDMNEEGVGMLEDCLFCTREFAEQNPETVRAFIYASYRGWEYACQNPEEAAEIVYEYGSSVSPEHQAYMAEQVKALCETDMDGNAVSEYGLMNDEALQQTLDLAKQYISLDDSAAAEALQAITLDDFRDGTYYDDAMASDGTFSPEKTDVSIQLKWLPQAQFMGFFVADALGYYEEAGFTSVNIISGGGDIGETTAVNNGTADFGTTWVSNLIAANAGGMDLLEVGQTFQRSGLVLVYKYENFQN